MGKQREDMMERAIFNELVLAAGGVNPTDEVRRILVDAVVGRGFPTLADAERMEMYGLAYRADDGPRIEWKWHRHHLENLDTQQLLYIYRRPV